MDEKEKIFYCTGCRTQVEVEEVQKMTAKNGRKMLKGRCKTCGRWTTKFVTG